MTGIKTIINNYYNHRMLIEGNRTRIRFYVKRNKLCNDNLSLLSSPNQARNVYSNAL